MNIIINASTNTQVDTDVLIGENDLDVKFAPNEGGFIFTRSSSSIDGIPRILKYQFGTSTQEVELFTAASMPDWD